VLAAAFLFNLGQGVLRPSLPLYLRQFFGANYRMVTLIPVVFGAGKWIANLPTGYLFDRLGRARTMVAGLVLIAGCDVASVAVVRYAPFLAARAVAGAGWAMFATVATTTMVHGAGARGRAISLLLMAETLGLLLGSTVGGWLYQGAGTTTPFLFEASCMLLAAAVVGWSGPPSPERRSDTVDWRALRSVIRVPGVVLVSLTNAALMGIQTGAIVFLFPLYLVERGSLSPQTVGFLIALSVLGRLIAIWIGGGVSDRRDRMPVLALSLVGLGLVLGSLGLVRNPWLLGLWSVLIGAGAGFTAGLPTTIIGDRVDPSLHGIAIGWLRTVTDAGMLLGPLLMGPLADAFGLAAPFLLAGAITCALAWVCHRHAATAT
jgi:predicted MFS family arabinose efflux permease